MRGFRTSTIGTSLSAVLAVACVDTSQPGPYEASPMLGEPEPIELIDTEPVPDALRQREPSGPYAWRNATIKGGGFVTGLTFSTAVPNLVFARTDVGGAYRFSVAEQRWFPLLDWVGQDSTNWLGVESIALDPSRPERVYLAAGTYLTAGDGVILRSDDFGETWTRQAIGTPMGGNANGRSMGERLAVDPSHPDRLYFGSRTSGLWLSDDAGESWQQSSAFSARGDAGLGLSFVLPDGSDNLYVGVATLAEQTLYRSRDGARSFEAVTGAPRGQMPHHAVLAGDGVVYLAYNDGPGPNDIRTGAVWRWDTNDDSWTNVSPRRSGFGGLAADVQRPGTIMAATIDSWAPDQIYRSTDGGQHWFEISGPATRDQAGADWLYFGGNELNATGWMGDLEIDPFNRSRALYVTGQGIWWSDDVTNTDAGQSASFVFRNEGLEETVALDVASPPSGAPLLSAVGDICGFRHDDLDVSPPQGMFDNPRFGNTTSLDFAEREPELVVRVGTGSGKRGAVSADAGASFQPFASEPPGTGAGTIAVSSDGQAFVWSPEGGAPARSLDRGRSWQPCSGAPAGARVASDRVNEDLFYAVDRRGVYVSRDGGASFTLTPFALPYGARPRSVFDHEGDVWISSSAGLYRSLDAGTTLMRVPHVNVALAVGFGRAAHEVDYPAVYLAGKVNGVAGLFRSDDAGESWLTISDDQHLFGSIGFIAGDRRSYGRVYLGTAGRGIVYGDPL